MDIEKAETIDLAYELEKLNKRIKRQREKKKYYKNAQHAERLAAAARRRIEAELTIDTMVEKVESLYLSLHTNGTHKRITETG